MNVPSDFQTIQAAVNAAHPGDTILIAPGRYKEAVVVKTPHITIRGLDRNKVLIDGEFKRSNGILVNKANDVTIENLTACCNTSNGILWSYVTGYTGHYLKKVLGGGSLLDRNYAPVTLPTGTANGNGHVPGELNGKPRSRGRKRAAAAS